jgi:F5/8 type C domain-containing protein/calcineurin-like phosphoesterase family protein/glycosyl hydrolase family 99
VRTFRTSPRWFGALIVVLMLCSLVAPIAVRQAPFVAAAEPKLTLEPDHARAGDTIKATGSRFPKKSDGVLVWDADGSELAKVKTDASGSFDAQFALPSVPDGNYTISVMVVDNDGAVVSDTAPITLQSPAEATNTAVPPAPTNTAVPPTEQPNSSPAKKPRKTPTDAATADSKNVSPTASTKSVRAAALSGDSLTLPIRAAFYYPWFPNAWQQGGIYPYTNYTPSNGFYDGGDPAIISQQIAAMQYGGIQAGISSWWGQGHHTDVRFPALLAGAAGTGFKWTIYYEAESLGDPSVSQITSDLTYLRDNYANDPSYLRINGKFVVFVYADGGDACGMADRWSKANTVGAYVVLKVFSGYLNCANQPDSWHQYSPAVSTDGQGAYSYSISPGFWKEGESPRLNRDLNRWAQNVQSMNASGAAWQLVVSFNEWGEGTSIESAKEWETGSGYGAYLDVLHANGQAVPATSTPAPAQTPTPKPTSAPTKAATATPGPTKTPTPGSGGASTPATAATKYRLVTSGASVNSAASTYVRDGKMSTVWKTKLFVAGPPSEAWVWVDLGASQKIGNIRWVFGEAGIADSFTIEGSNDLKNWSAITTRSGKPVGVWQEKVTSRTYRYIRFRFENPNRDRYLGGLAEVQVWSLGEMPPLPSNEPPAPTATPVPTSTAPSGGGNTPRPSPPAGATVLEPEADSYVTEATPDANLGTQTTVQVDAGSGERKVGYIRFTVDGLTGNPGSAIIQLYVRSGTVDGPTVQLAANTWDENKVTWANRPSLTGNGIEDKGALDTGTWVQYDVTSLITGNGTYTFAFENASRDGISFGSREDNARLPLLILTGAAGDEVTPSPTPPVSGGSGATETATPQPGGASPTATAAPPTPTTTPKPNTPVPTATAAPPTPTTTPKPNTPVPTATPKPNTPVPTATPKPPTPTPTSTPRPGGGADAVLLAVGDVASCGSTGDEATGKLLDSVSGPIAGLGDYAYESGSATDFKNCFDPSWGRHKSRMHPAAGNHEYNTAGAAPYYAYFGAAAGDSSKGYYSYNVGTWHIVVLNSNCSKIGGCDTGSAQYAWLKADLAANPASCTLAYWHHPLFSSGEHGNNTVTKPLWQLLQTNGAELVLTGHDHDYERFAPQNADGVATANGIREFVVGTGGRGHYSFPTVRANSEVRYNSGFGVLRLVLKDGSYTWEFISEAGKTFTDSGSGTCHGAPIAEGGQPGTLAVVPSSGGVANVADIRRNTLGDIRRIAA